MRKKYNIVYINYDHTNLPTCCRIFDLKTNSNETKRHQPFALLMIITPCITSAQQTDSSINKTDTALHKPAKNAWIESMDQYLAVKLSLNNDIAGFHISNSSVYDIKSE